MSFDVKISIIAAIVEQRLRDHLSGTRGPVSPPARLAEAMRYAALGGGKRLRPLLLIECAGLFGVKTENALDAAAALEFVHCYSLAHDDLPAMDDDDLRRGRPTVHKAFDEATAILAGDSLLTLAFEILSRRETHPEPAVRAELILALARAAGWTGMAGGQALDLEAEGRTLQVEQIRQLQSMKTGALIRYACEAGAILGGADPRQRGALGAFGRAIGQAFQLADDLLDVEGDSSRMGKRTGKDRGAGKATLVAAFGPEKARLYLADLEEDAISRLKPFGDKAATLIEAARFITRRQH
ncbi:MAG: farnesyl diphosphate synthase [Pseudomonadota bacterium]|nr:farnesyl diphosphate synthase [Pseudomonadota bacterium]